MTIAKAVSYLEAAADYSNAGAIETPVFESEIFDIVRRGSAAFKRIRSQPATGHPHRYWEQIGVALAGAVDPRSLSATASGPTRVERPAFIKAVTAQSNISLFDKDVTEQQGQFAYVVAKDIEDIVSGVEVLRSQMLWTGTDTSLMAPTTPQWVGALTQITQQTGSRKSTVAKDTSIIDALKSQIAAMVGDVQFRVMPTAIYINPVANDLIDREAKAQHIDLHVKDVEGGVSVKFLSTQAGQIPLIPEPYLPADTTAKYTFSAPPAGQSNYYAVIVTEPYIEIPVISGKEFNPNPRLFQLGLIGNLAGQYVAVKFDTLIVKGANYAHAVVAIQN